MGIQYNNNNNNKVEDFLAEPMTLDFTLLEEQRRLELESTRPPIDAPEFKQAAKSGALEIDYFKQRDVYNSSPLTSGASTWEDFK
jgi:hypothetical protein